MGYACNSCCRRCNRFGAAKARGFLGFRFRVEGLGIWIWGLRFRVEGLGIWGVVAPVAAAATGVATITERTAPPSGTRSIPGACGPDVTTAGEPGAISGEAGAISGKDGGAWVGPGP